MGPAGKHPAQGKVGHGEGLTGLPRGHDGYCERVLFENYKHGAKRKVRGGFNGKTPS